MATVVEVKLTRLLSRLDEDELHSMKVTDLLGRPQDTNVIDVVL
ncbi:hypothetical protein V7167_17385 [Bacillus toyonensis]|nr:hypothetical protein [Bacillus toyonensis]MED2615673.1 hypothetical protein [Bacillus toyonensis]